MPQPPSKRSIALPQPKPSHRKRLHEMAPSRYSKHHSTATVTAHIRWAGSNHSRCPDCGQRQLEGRRLQTIVPSRTAQSRPFGHCRRRRQLCRKYFLFCSIYRQAHRSYVQQSHRIVPLYVPRGQTMLPHCIPLQIQCHPGSPDIRV